MEIINYLFIAYGMGLIAIIILYCYPYYVINKVHKRELEKTKTMRRLKW